MPASWDRFRATPLGELLTGTAHRTHPADTTAPLGERFAGQTILALHVALDRAATVRVAFDRAGGARLSGIRDIRRRGTAELGEVLRAEAAATGAGWVVVVFATGWQAVLGQRAARPDPSERVSGYARYRLMFESPEIAVPRAQVDRVYTAVDHPVLDKSVVFSLRRRDLEDIIGEIRQCRLGVAALRIGVAAQLELWLAREGEGGLQRDLLITDAVSALLLNTEQGDFALPTGAAEAEQPRQAVQRPNAIEQDIARFVAANRGRPLTYLGPEELGAALKKQVDSCEFVRPAQHPAHDIERAALDPAVRHDLNFESFEVRPALPRAWRRIAISYAAVVLVLLAVTIANLAYALQSGFESFGIERENARRDLEMASDTATAANLVGEYAQADALKTWLAGSFHAQLFCYRVLRDIPANAAVDRLMIEVKDGQLTLTFMVLGDQEAQLAAHRVVERAVTELKYKIGAEDEPLVTGSVLRGVQYRLHLIVPDFGEAVTS